MKSPCTCGKTFCTYPDCTRVVWDKDRNIYSQTTYYPNGNVCITETTPVSYVNYPRDIRCPTCNRWQNKIVGAEQYTLKGRCKCKTRWKCVNGVVSVDDDYTTLISE